MHALSRLSAACILAAALSGHARGETVQAAPADSFVESIGINVHLNWAGTIWQSAAATWRRRLGETGIRYVRTGTANTSFARDNFNILYTDYGIRANILLQPLKSDGSLNTAPVKSMLDYLASQVGSSKIVSFEGPNEYSESKYHGNTDWAAEIRTFQSHLYRTVKAHPAFRTHPVAGPTIWRRLETDYKLLGDLNAYTDYGNLHYYNAGRKPPVYPREVYYNGPTYESPVDMAIQNAQITTPGTRILVTETGFNVKETLPKSRFYVPARTSAKYTLRHIAELFRRRGSVARTYLFSLIDTDSTKQYGLLRRDLTPRPSFFAIKNAISILADRGPPAPLGSLSYNLIGYQTDVRTTVLQKRDGRFYLLIWLDAISYNQSTLMEVNPTRSLTLDVAGHAFSQMKVYHPTALGMTDPNRGSLPVQTISAPRQVRITVPDHLTIIELTR